MENFTKWSDPQGLELLHPKPKGMQFLRDKEEGKQGGNSGKPARTSQDREIHSQNIQKSIHKKMNILSLLNEQLGQVKLVYF